MWSSFTAIFRKEFLHIRRDRATLIMAFSIPLFQLMLFGFIDQTVRNVPTVVVDQDRSPESRLLIDRMRATKTFDIRRITFDPREAREDITAARAKVGVMIPPDYHKKRVRGADARLLVLIDGSDQTVSAQALASVNGLVAQANLEQLQRAVLGAETPMAAQPIILFNPSGRTANFIIPGLVAILLQIVALVLAAIAIVRERERGTLEQLLVTPINPLGLMLGKLGPYLFIGIGEMSLILIAMRYGFSVPIRGSLVFLFVMAVIYLFALLALGLFISTRTRPRAPPSRWPRCSSCRPSSSAATSFPARASPSSSRPSAGSSPPLTWWPSCAASCSATPASSSSSPTSWPWSRSARVWW